MATESAYAAEPDCFGLEVAPISGPTQLQFGGRSTLAVKVENPNAAGACGDDGIIVVITFNGTPEAIESIDPGDDMVCSAANPAPFAFKERCVGSTFAAGSKATISIEAHIDGPQDRIAAEVQTLHQTLKPRMRPGQSALRDLIVTSAPVNAPAPKPEGSPSLPSLKQGASGDTVSTLQWLLRHHGQDLDVDGDFGDQTASAVKAFQSSRSITPADGVVNVQTWQALFVTLRKGSRNDAVSGLQQQLNAQGLEIAIDGDFGDETDGAVREFQRKHRLTVDGEVALETWSALIVGG